MAATAVSGANVQRIITGKTYYTCEDIMTLLGIGKNQAYDIIKELQDELVEKGYARYPRGKVPKRYFHERYYFEEVN